MALNYIPPTNVYEVDAETLTAEAIGLGNVDNTADTDKPVSDAAQSALDAKADEADLTSYAPLESPAFTGTPTGIDDNIVAPTLGLPQIEAVYDLPAHVTVRECLGRLDSIMIGILTTLSGQIANLEPQDLEFNAETPSDWDGGVSPSQAKDALDQLAARIKALEP